MWKLSWKQLKQTMKKAIVKIFKSPKDDKPSNERLDNSAQQPAAMANNQQQQQQQQLQQQVQLQQRQQLELQQRQQQMIEEQEERERARAIEELKQRLIHTEPLAPPTRFILPTLEQFTVHVNESVNSAPELAFNKFQYRAIRRLGNGSYGEVLESEHVPTGKLVAIKMIDKRRMRRKEERLRTEIEIMSRVQHRNLIRLLDWGLGNLTVYLVMEVARGGELLGKIQQVGSFYEKDAVEITTALTDAIAYLHRMDVVHRDLKPENIFLRDPIYASYSDLVIGDFGISRILSDEKPILKSKIGSCGYIAPEILVGRGYGKQADMWSLGVIVHILLCGAAPYAGSDWDHELQVILQNPLTFSQQAWVAVSEAAKDFVFKCMVLDPNQRMSSEQALQHCWLTEMDATTISSNDLFDYGLGEGLDTERSRRAVLQGAEQVEPSRSRTGASTSSGVSSGYGGDAESRSRASFSSVNSRE